MFTRQIVIAYSLSSLALGLALPQTPDLSALPSCAQTAALTAAQNSGCALTSTQCFCQNAISSLKSAIDAACSPADQLAACNWGNTACSAFGAQLDCSALGGGSAASSPAPASNTDAAVVSGDSNNTPTSGAPCATDSSSVPMGSDSSSMPTSTMGSMSSPAPTTLATMTNGTTTTASSMNGTMATTTCHACSSAPSNVTSPTAPFTGGAEVVVGRQSAALVAVAVVAMTFALL